jgi:fatty-acyl-CoA synthase
MKRLASVEAGIQFDAPVCIQFTSGTTGTPKGATLSHHNVINNAAQLAEAMGIGQQDRLCVPVPMFHCFGYVASVLVCALSGATMVFAGPAFDPLSVLKTVHDEGCTALHGVPTMFIAELAHPDFSKFDLSSLRTGCMAGATCPETVVRQVIERMHMKDMLIPFGMTETSPIATQTAATTPSSGVPARSGESCRTLRSRSSILGAGSYHAARPGNSVHGATL